MATLAFCFYIALTYSFLRSCTESRLPPKFGFLVASLWPLLLTWAVVSDIVKGINELTSKRK